MPKNKLTRKELLKEPDQFITFTGKLVQFGIENKKTIFAGVIGIFSALLIMTLYRYFSEKSLNSAFTDLYHVQETYETALTDSSEKAFSKVKDDLQKLVDSNEKNSAGKFAKVVYGNLSFTAKDYDKAIQLYQQALSDYADAPSVKNAILNGLAYSYIQKNDIQNALKYYEMIASGTDKFLKEDALFQLGRLYAAANQPDKSKEMFQKVISDDPTSIYADLIKEKIGSAESHPSKE